MIEISVTGQDRVVAMLKGLPYRVFGEVKGEVSRITLALLRLVKEDKLSGGVLHNRTGTLRRKVNSRVIANAQSITGTVGVKLAYAAAHEFGVDKEVQVKEHLVQIKQAFGKPLASPVLFIMPPHSRHMKLPERSFLRSALREMGPEIQQGLREALARAVQKA